MAVDQRIETTLRKAEHELRLMIAEAAKAGDYEGVDVSRRIAGQVQGIISTLQSRRALDESVSTSPAGQRAVMTARRGAKPPSRHKKSVYPKFHIRDGVLYKTGWSKKRNQEYVHKVPREAYDRIIRAIGALVQRRSRPFTAEQTAEQLDLDGQSVPVYQIYVTLALLRYRGVVQKQGREGYVADGDLTALGDQVWKQL